MAGSWRMFGLLLRARARMLANAVRATPTAHKAVLAGLALFGVLLFLSIGAACAALVLLQQGGPRTGLTPGAAALVGRIYEYLFFFVLAGSVPFVAATLFQSDDLPLLLTTPVPPRAVVAAKLLDAAVVNAAQFVALGVPVLAGVGWAVGLSAAGWLWLLAATLLLLTLSPAATALLLLAAARLLGMRRVRLVVMLISIGLGLGITSLAVVGASRATRSGALDMNRLTAALRGQSLPPAVSSPFTPLAPDDGGTGPPGEKNGAEADAAPRGLPSAWAAAMLEDTAGGRPLGPGGAMGLLKLVAATAAVIALCLLIGPGVLASEAFLEGQSGSEIVSGGTQRPLLLRGLPAPVAGLLLKDLKYVGRDLILLGQIGTTLILFFVPFLLKFAQESGGSADNDIYTALALGMLALIVYMATSILSLTSVGLEGRGFWLVLASPVSRRAFLRAKWLLAFGLSAAIGGVLTLLDGIALWWPAPVALGTLAVLICACFALSGLGVGLAGLFPRFVYENPAHRAGVWALILGFVLATGYLIVCTLMAGLAYVAVTQGGIAIAGAAAVGTLCFLLVSVLTGLIPVALAERRLRGYEWEY